MPMALPRATDSVRAASSSVVCVAGSVMTGASFAGSIETLTVAVSVSPLASRTT